MKDKWLLLMVLIITQSAFGAPGCMDSSWHVQRLFDTKEYHIVTHQVGNHETFCPCPCKKVSLDRGECFECKHRRYIAPMHIIRYQKGYCYTN